MRKLVLRLSLFLGVLALALLGAELVVARWYPVGVPLFQLDPVLLHRTVPGAQRVIAMDLEGGRRVRTSIGPRGYRGPDPAPTKVGARVVVYGDSLALAENVPLEETFVERLGVHLAAAGRPVEMVNAGVTGYGPDQALLKLEAELEQLDPDLVVFVLCAHNDHGDLMRNKLFRLGADGALERGGAQLSPELEQRFREGADEAGRPALVRGWQDLQKRRERRRERESGEVLPYTSWYLEAAAGEYAEYAAARDRQVYSLFHDYYDVDVAGLSPDSQQVRTKRALMAAVLERMHSVCSARGTRLFSVVVPSAVDLVADFGLRIDTGLVPGHDPLAQVRACVVGLTAAGVPHLDLGATMRAEADPGGLFVGGTDFHWNARGQDLGARAVARELLTEGLLGP